MRPRATRSAQNRALYRYSAEQALYRNMVGSLLYLACWTRPDIALAVSELSRFVSDPSQNHMQAEKHLLRYLKGSIDLGLRYSKPKNSGPMDRPNVLWGFVDSDWAGCPDSRRSTSGYTLMLNGAAVSWKSKRQPVVALSTAEAEFIAASSMVQEVIYARRLLERLRFPQTDPTPIFRIIPHASSGQGVLSAVQTERSTLIFASILCMRPRATRSYSWSR